MSESVKRDVLTFTKATGNFKEIKTKEQLFKKTRKLAGLLREELDEMDESNRLEWLEGLLDDWCDIQVYQDQIKNDLEQFGVRCSDAFEAVCENINTKYTTSITLAIEWLEAMGASYKYQNIPCDIYIDTNILDGVNHYCLKRESDGKVMKWVGFPRIDLSEFLPDSEEK